MTVPGVVVLVTVALTGLLALLSCVAFFIWLAGQWSGEPVTFRRACLSTALLAVVLGGLSVVGLAAWLLLAARGT